MQRVFLAFLVTVGLLLMLPAALALAGPVLPQAVILSQPNGAPVEAMPYGDEWDNGYETPDGFTIVKDASGVWSFAVLSDAGTLTASGLLPSGDPPAGVTPHLRTVNVYNPNRFPLTLPGASGLAGASGVQPVLLILVYFTNQNPVGSTPAQWSTQFFGATNSARHYYQEVSYGQLTLTPARESHGTANDGVIGWLQLNYDHPNTQGSTGTANMQITRDVILAANPYIDFASYDANHDGEIAGSELHLVIIVAGYETSFGGTSAACTPNVWGHNGSLGGSVPAPAVDGVIVGGGATGGYSQFGEWHCNSNTDTPGHMATLGIMVHEMGHDINWPDLYDTDNSSYGVGPWSIMGLGSWNRVGEAYQGSSPAHPDAFLKWYQGWLTPSQITGSAAGVAIQQAETTQSAMQILNNPNDVDWRFYGNIGGGEYFLLENRQLQGYDAGLPGCGLLIWHIDETRTWDNSANANDSRRLVDVEEADGRNDLDFKANRGDNGDPYPGSSANRTFNASSNPNSNLYGGAASGVSVTNISNCGATMSADISAPGGPAATWTPTHTATRTATRSATPTPTATPTRTQTPAATPTRTQTSGGPTATHTQTQTRVPGGSWTIYLPIIIANYPPQPPTATPTATATPGAAGWVTLMSENFEGSFPAGWQLVDQGSGPGTFTWGKRACRPSGGGFSGWAVGGGANGADLACASDYPDSVDSWMIYGPFSLAGASAAQLRFEYWLNSEPLADALFALASTDGHSFHGLVDHGLWESWSDAFLDLSAVPDLGNLLGQPQVWIAFRFVSDGGLTFAEGAYLDKIVLRTCTGGSCAGGPSLETQRLRATPGARTLTE